MSTSEKAPRPEREAAAAGSREAGWQTAPAPRGAVKIIASGRDWHDLVLPVDHVEALRRLARAARKPAVPGGLNALFVGPTGTGKTLAAQIIARELGADLWRVNLSEVVTEYIGETEKNLAGIFAAADRSGVVLFFDEADALFGRRSAVEDAHDRYANEEVRFLLARIEDFSRLVILATNLAAPPEEAFCDRFGTVIDFPMPDATARHQLWQRLFPPNVARLDEVDLGQLARSHVLSGGHIRKVVLTAARLASAGREPVATSHVLEAIRTEGR